MTKILGCFVLKYAEPQLPWEVQRMIVDHLRSTQLEYILTKYPNKKWRWADIQNLADLTKVIKMFPKLGWGWRSISLNYKNTLEFIEEHFNENWDMHGISRNKHLTIDFIEKHSDWEWDWYVISSNFGITIEDIERYPDKPWSFRYISANPNINMQFIEKHSNENWDWQRISSNPAITINDINDNPNKPWDWDQISMNPSITMDVIKKYPDKPWDLDYLRGNPNITLDFVEENNMNINEINTPNSDLFKIQYMEKYPDKSNWQSESFNSYLTIDFVKRHINEHWDLTCLILHPNSSTKDKLWICEKID